MLNFIFIQGILYFALPIPTHIVGLSVLTKYYYVLICYISYII